MELIAELFVELTGDLIANLTNEPFVELIEELIVELTTESPVELIPELIAELIIKLNVFHTIVLMDRKSDRRAAR